MTTFGAGMNRKHRIALVAALGAASLLTAFRVRGKNFESS